MEETYFQIQGALDHTGLIQSSISIPLPLTHKAESWKMLSLGDRAFSATKNGRMQLCLFLEKLERETYNNCYSICNHLELKTCSRHTEANRINVTVLTVLRQDTFQVQADRPYRHVLKHRICSCWTGKKKNQLSSLCRP